MILALLVLGVALAALPGLRRDPPERLPLQEWVPVATGAVLAGIVSIEAALVLIALPTVTHALGVSAIADACHRVLAPFSPAPSALGWLSAALAVGLAVGATSAAVRARRRARDARAEPWLGQHQRVGDCELVVLPTATPLAFTAPGAPPQIVVSTGLIDRVSIDAFDAIVRHETAHHRLGHARYLVLLAGAEGAAAVLRPVRRSVATIRRGLEMWADHVAGPDHDSRRSLRCALRSFSDRDGRVQDRVHRLLRRIRVRPIAWRALSYAPVPLMVALAVLLAVGWLAGAHRMLALTAGCV